MEEKSIVLTKEGFKDGSGSFPVKVENIDGKTIRDLRQDSSIAAVAPAVPMQLIVPVRNKDKLDTINNQSITWGIKAVGADTSPNTGKGIIVAVLDSGIKASHPAFHGIDVVEKDFTGEGDGDTIGHGTHCAGTIFGRDTNGMRIGVATGVEKALVGKVIGEQSGPSSDRVCEAIQWAFDNGANIISMSLSFDFPGYVKFLEESGFSIEASVSRALQGYRENLNLFENLTSLLKQQADESQRGLIIVAAGGNETRRLYESSSEDDSPAAREKRIIDKTSFGKKRLLRRFYEVEVGPPGIIENIISVGALGIGARGLRVAEFSNTSADISAPGVEIISASLEGDLESKSGTSMAAPHVAGVAALWAEKLKKDGQLTSRELASRILGTATEQSLEAGFDPLDVGMGLVFAPQDEK